jgi:integrase/recombinase XerC
MAESGSLAPLWKGLPSDPKAAAPALLRSFLEARKDSTFRTYRQGLEAFQKFLGVPSVEAASGQLLAMKHGDANKVALDFKNWLIKNGRKAATVNTRLSALRSLVDLARTVGIVPWNLEVKNMREEKYRDTSGPGLDLILSKVRELSKIKEPKAARDATIIALMGFLALRRGEVVKLDLEDVENDRLHIMGKGKTDEEPLTLPPELAGLIETWVGYRGKHPGPLFVHFRQPEMKERLSDRSVGRITNGLELGHAHGLRHSSITQALDENNGDVRKVARFSRHKNVQTVLKYDDNRKDLGGEVAKGLSKKLSEEP